MTKTAKTPGQVLVDRMEAYVARYVHFPNHPAEDQALVSALWCLATWVSERFPMVAYCHASASTSGEGKTVWLETAKLICRSAQVFVTIRMLSVVRWIEATQGLATYMLDECEKLGSEALGEAVTMLASGYRKGGQHMISTGTKFQMFGTFCSKAFAGIGDLRQNLRERSIVLYLQRGKPVADFWSEMPRAEEEAAGIVGVIFRLFKGLDLPMVTPDFLTGRDREIWTPIYSIAHALELDEATMRRLRRAMVDLTNAKRLPPRKYHDVSKVAETNDRTSSRQLCEDIQSVIREGEKHIRTSVLVERLKELELGQWRSFKGVGLDMRSLGDLLDPFGVATVAKPVMTRKEAERTGQSRTAKVYTVAALRGLRGASVAARKADEGGNDGEKGGR